MHSQHNHPGQAEPRSYGQTHHEQRVVDLNSSSLEELAELPMIGRERAEAMIQSRPFRSWEDVARVPGISNGIIDDLRSGGATLAGSES